MLRLSKSQKTSSNKVTQHSSNTRLGFKLPGITNHSSSRTTKMNRVLDDDLHLYSEHYFHEMLTLERKRSERTRKQFMLMMLDIRGLVSEHKGKDPLDKMADILCVGRIVTLLDGASRETDIKGWYKKNQVIGLLYTETTGTNEKVMIDKVRSCLMTELDERQIELINISCFMFPTQGGTRPIDGLFYTDAYKDIGKNTSSGMKRVIDIAGSLVAILIFSPLFIVIPIIIKLTSKGPVFFMQERAGLGGKPFKVIKFRTMRPNNDDSAHKEYMKKLIKNNKEVGADGVFKIKDDPRVTPIGRWLRKTSLDELPQFFNVFWGNMSLVGPRPAIPYEVEEYDTWHKRRVLQTKPGITCIWQVEGRSATTFEGQARMDIEYINKWSILLDLKLIIKTPLAVIASKGAY
ncbi:MAG: sugar transferase [Chitinivibrionales bacterium]|nr:sugar transferase [Chitinivibrionales bacterium]